MKRRLLIDSTVLEFVGGLRKRDRDFLFQRFEEIRAFPDNHADYLKRDESAGRWMSMLPDASPFRTGMISPTAM